MVDGKSNPQRQDAGRPGEQLTFAVLAEPSSHRHTIDNSKPSCVCAQNGPPTMFTKPPLYTGKGGPSRFDPEHDPELQGGR